MVRTGTVRQGWQTTLAMVVAAAGLAVGGCGGGTGASGVASDKRIDSLSPAERGALCDYQAGRFGGYGKSMDCGGGLSIDAPDSQAACVAQFPPTCAATVADFEACENQISCSNVIPPACASLLGCDTTGGGSGGASGGGAGGVSGAGGTSVAGAGGAGGGGAATSGVTGSKRIDGLT